MYIWNLCKVLITVPSVTAIKFDGVQVFGYSAWSLVDGFEWNYEYNVRRGLFYVDFNNPDRTRTPKTSAQYYRRVVGDNGFPSNEPSTKVTGHFPCDFHWGITDSTLQVRREGNENIRQWCKPSFICWLCFHTAERVQAHICFCFALQVRIYPFSPQFIDPHLYSWNLTGDGSLRPVLGVKLHTRPAQCTDYLAIRDHLRLFASTGASHYRFALNWSLILPQGDLSDVNTEALR